MSGKTILLVDDDPVFVKATSMKLRNEGFQVLTAEDGASTLGALRQAKPDLILLDIVFPPDVPHGGVVSWDGFDIMAWLRQMGGTPGSLVVLVTAGDPAEHVDRARKGGASGLLQKSCDGELMKLVHQLLG